MIKTHCILREQSNDSASSVDDYASPNSFGIATIGEDRKSIYYPTSDLTSILTFPFDSIHAVRGHTNDNCLASLDESISKLVDEKKNATVLIVGDNTGKRLMMEGSNASGYSSMLSGCTDVLLEKLAAETNGENNNNSSKLYRVSVSWFGIHTLKAEGIVDMLKTAGGGGLGLGLGLGLGGEGIDPRAVLRDEGYGDGTSINGLWEIEVNTGADVSDIIRRIRESALSINPLLHNVFKFTVERLSPPEIIHLSKHPSQNYEQSLLSFESKTPHHLNFVTLASTNGSDKSINEFIRDKKSLSSTRIGMVLRDLLCGYSFGVGFCVIDPSLEEAASSLEALEFVTSLSNLTSTLDSAYENENGNGNGNGGADNENVLINVEQEDFFFEEDDNNIGNRLDIEQLQSPPSSNKNISPKMLQQLRLRQQRLQLQIDNNKKQHEHQKQQQLLIQQQHEHQLEEALRASKTESKQAENRIRGLEATLGNLKFENDELKNQLSGEAGATLRRGDKEKLRKALCDVKDYETYKDVMEQTFHRMKGDIEQIQVERDEYCAKWEKGVNGLRVGGSREVKLKKEARALKMENDIEKAEKLSNLNDIADLQTKYQECVKKNKAAAKEIAKMRMVIREQNEEKELMRSKLAVSAAENHSHVHSHGHARGEDSLSTITRNSTTASIKKKLLKADQNLNEARKIMFNK